MQRPRTRSRRNFRPLAATAMHPLGTPRTGLSPNTGPLASAAWLAMLDLAPRDPKWFVEIVLGTPTVQFQLEIYAEEWGYLFTCDDRTSWIRVTDIPFVHGQDDHELLAETPRLKDIGRLLRRLEKRHKTELPRATAVVRTSMLGVEQIVRAWTMTL